MKGSKRNKDVYEIQSESLCDKKLSNTIRREYSERVVEWSGDSCVITVTLQKISHSHIHKHTLTLTHTYSPPSLKKVSGCIYFPRMIETPLLKSRKPVSFPLNDPIPGVQVHFTV